MPVGGGWLNGRFYGFVQRSALKWILDANFVGSRLGISDGKILALEEYATSPLYEERVALEYADAITLTDRDVDDDLFQKVRGHFSEDAVVELTAAIAWENSSSKFNRALRVPSQGLWKRDRSK